MWMCEGVLGCRTGWRLVVVFVEFGVGKECGYCGWSFVGKAIISKGLGVEGVGTMVEHLLGIVELQGGSLNAKVAEHGVRFPSAQELDGILVNAGAQESSGATRAKGSGTDEGW